MALFAKHYSFSNRIISNSFGCCGKDRYNDPRGSDCNIAKIEKWRKNRFKSLILKALSKM